MVVMWAGASSGRRCFSSSMRNTYQFTKNRFQVSPEKLSSPDEVVRQSVRNHDKIFVQMAAGNPQSLLRALANQHDRFEYLEFFHLLLAGEAPHLQHNMRNFRVKSPFLGDLEREAVKDGRADYVPAFFSELPDLFRRRLVELDVAMVHVSPPDRHGWCSLGTSIDCTLAAVKQSRTVVAQINPNMPRTHGDGLLHVNEFDFVVEVDEPIPEVSFNDSCEVSQKIGEHVASLIPDGACLQVGIGNIPNAVLGNLKNHRHLGVHTEMFSDGFVDLIENGVITNRMKGICLDVNVATFLVGTRRLYDFVDDNPSVLMLPVDFVNNPVNIGQQPNMCAVNSALEVDLTGQVCADSIGPSIYSGVGGQMDFMRGAAMSPGGKPIIALPSTTNSGESRISAILKEGAGVVTTRAHVHYIVTEYGVAEMFGKSYRQRAKNLIEIAHPDHREVLEREAVKRFGLLS